MGRPAANGPAGPKGIPRAVAPRGPPKEEPAGPATLEDMANDLKARYEAEKEIGSLREEKVAKTEEVRWLKESVADLKKQIAAKDAILAQMEVAAGKPPEREATGSRVTRTVPPQSPMVSTRAFDRWDVGSPRAPA